MEKTADEAFANGTAITYKFSVWPATTIDMTMLHARPLRTVLDILILIVLSLVLALAVNAFRTESLPVFNDISAFLSGEADIPEIPRLTPAQAREAAQSVGAVFIDARSPDEYAEGRLPMAVNLPPEATEDEFTAKTLLLDQATPIIVYCGDAACGRSDLTAVRLARAGFRDVSVLDGGLGAWLNDNGELEPGL